MSVLLHTEVMDLPPNPRFYQMFELQAARHPDRPAIICDNRTLTFSQLNARANQLAHYLQAAGVGPEVLVGIYLHQSVDVPVAILSVLKSGGAYVPIDPAFPPERVAWILQNASQPVVLTQEKLSSDVAKNTHRVIALDSAWPSIARESATNPNHTVALENLAYVIYTSGSTGSPKGVMLTRGNLANYVRALQPEIGIRPDDVYLCTGSIAVTSFRRQLMLPLSEGATVVIANVEQRKDPIALSSLIKHHRVTVLDAVPSFLRNMTAILSELEPTARRGVLDNDLRLILTAGEPLLADVPRTWMHEFHHPAQHINLYGQTETGTVSIYRIPRDLDASLSVIPIGHPLANVELLLLDADRRPVPVGEPGEMYVAGASVGRGYFNDPELTEQKFLAHPSKPGTRLYKTGDWARFLPDGNLMHLGRRDHQIKVRGFRVNTGEIEAVLARHPGVKESAVIAREDMPGDRRLTAYIVPKQPDALLSDQVRRFLATKLPDYMVPSQFVALAALPTLPSGKVDRGALPSPGVSARRAVWRAPRTREEEVLCELFAELLGVERIGLDDSFLELGGDSLLAAKLLFRLEREFGIGLSMASVFEAPTVQQLAAILRQGGSASPLPRVIPIQPAGSRPPFFCLGGGPAFLPLAHDLGLDQPILGIDVDHWNSASLPTPYRLEDIAACVVKSMRTVQPSGPYYLCGWCRSGLLAYETARQLAAEGSQVALLALIDTRNSSYFRRLSWLARCRVVGQRMAFHVTNLLRATWKERASYVRERLNVLTGRVKRRFWQFSYDAGSHLNGGGLHDSERIVHIASLRYEPQPYSGHVVLFQSAWRPSGAYWQLQFGWRDLVSGGVECHELPGDHTTVLAEPAVGILARKLRPYLQDAQESSPPGILTSV